MIWTEGRILPPDQLHVDIRDATFQHGLGLFETLRTWAGFPTLLTRHLERMRRSASELGLELNADRLPDVGAVARLIAASPGGASGSVADFRIRITLSGGRPGLGPGRDHPALWMTAAALELPPRPRAAVIRRTIQVADDDPLARHKTLNYWRKRIALTQAAAEGADEVLCVTPDGRICEGARTNIFIVRDGGLVTPSTDGPLLPGIMRRVVLERATGLGLAVVEGPLTREELADADEAFLTNSVQGMLPIARLFDRDLPAPGPVTVRLRSDLLPWLESGGPPP
jgi:branched-subunit amino acid aminotransferase/4-amino-4-deoxychorismate lyase